MAIDRSRLLTLPSVSLIIANLFPLVGVLFWGWDAFYVVLLYWAENLIVGFYTVVKMFAAKVEHPVARLFKIIPAAFFAFHYGFFCGIHGMFVFAIFKHGEDFQFGKTTWPCFFAFLQIFINAIGHALATLPKEMFFVLAGLFISHGIGFVHNYILKGEYLNAKIGKLMNEPYPRIFVLHIAIIFGGFATMAMGSPIGLLIVFVILKAIFEFNWYLKQQQKTADLPLVEEKDK